jgi:hypothetical protein
VVDGSAGVVDAGAGLRQGSGFEEGGQGQGQ